MRLPRAGSVVARSPFRSRSSLERGNSNRGPGSSDRASAGVSEVSCVKPPARSYSKLALGVLAALASLSPQPGARPAARQAGRRRPGRAHLSRDRSRPGTRRAPGVPEAARNAERQARRRRIALSAHGRPLAAIPAGSLQRTRERHTAERQGLAPSPHERRHQGRQGPALLRAEANLPPRHRRLLRHRRLRRHRHRPHRHRPPVPPPPPPPPVPPPPPPPGLAPASARSSTAAGTTTPTPPGQPCSTSSRQPASPGFASTSPGTGSRTPPRARATPGTSG